MNPGASFTLAASPEELQRLLADPTSRTPEPLRTLLRRAAVVESFDFPLFDAVLGGDLQSKEEHFDLLTNHPLVELLPSIPEAPRRYQIAASLRPLIFAAAWIAPATVAGAPDAATPELQSLSRQLAAYYKESDDYVHLYHLIAAEQDDAARRFAELFDNAEAAFDLPRCHALLRIFDERSALLGSAVKATINRHRFRLDTRTQWADEYYSTTLYFERTTSQSWWDELRKGADHWLLHIFAPGGAGKTMYVRHLIARRCVPEAIPVGYVDFDYVLLPDLAVVQPWRLLVSLIDQINTQIEGRPFGELLADFARYQHPVDARAIVRLLPPQTVTDEEGQRLRDELILRVASTLTEARGEDPVVVIFDTLENLRQRRLDLAATFALLRDLRAQCPCLRVVLAGRFNLAYGDPGEEDDQRNAYRTLFGDQQRTVLLQAFTADEARTYLAQYRKITDADLVAAILARARSEPDSATTADKPAGEQFSPFKLSLLADLVTYAPDVTAATILAYEAADTAYLIERVVDRIEHRLVRFVLRYGVVPRYLTRDYLATVLQPYLAAVAAGRTDLDDPQADALPADVLHRQSFSLKGQVTTVDVDELWTELASFTAEHSWVSPAGRDVVRFHSDVVAPMLRLLRKSRQRVLQQLHHDSATYCEAQAAQQSQQTSRWLSEAVYHMLAAGAADVLAYWQATWTKVSPPEDDRALAQAITLGNETLAFLAEPIADPAADPALATRQQDLLSVVARDLAFAQLAELAPSDLRRLLVLVAAGDPTATQVAATDLAVLSAQLDLSEGRHAQAESTARQVIVDLGDRVSSGGVVVMKRTRDEATRIAVAASSGLGEHQQAIATLRAALDSADGEERRRLLRQLAAHYEQQGAWIDAAVMGSELREMSMAQHDSMGAASATADCVRMLSAAGDETAAVALADATATWLAAPNSAQKSADQGRDLWLVGLMAAERDLAAQLPVAAQTTLDRLAANDGVQQFLKRSSQMTDISAAYAAEHAGLFGLPFVETIDARLRAQVAAACLDSDSAIRTYEQIAYDMPVLANQPVARAEALLAAATVASDAGDFQRAQKLLAGLASISETPAILRARQLLMARLYLAIGDTAPTSAAMLLAEFDTHLATLPQRVEHARLRVLAENGVEAAWAALIDALGQLPTPGWRLAAVGTLAGATPPNAAQAKHLRELLHQPAGEPPQLPLGRLRLAAVYAAVGDANGAAAALREVQTFAVAHSQWGVLRQVYTVWDAVMWPDGALVSAPLPAEMAANSSGRFVAGVLWLEQGLRLVASRTFIAQGAELVERSAAVLSPQSSWFAHVLLGRARVALAHGDDGAGRQLADGAAAAFTALGDPLSAAQARSLMATTTIAGDEASVVAKGRIPPKSDELAGAPTSRDVALPVVLSVEQVRGAAWQVTARRGSTVLDQWQATLDASQQAALTLRGGEVIGGQFADAFAKNWPSWAATLGELVTTPALRVALTNADPPGDLCWRLPVELAWLPWEFMVLRAPGQSSRASPRPFVVTPACRHAYRDAAATHLAQQPEPPAPDAPILVVRTSEVAERIAQRGYSTFAGSDLVRSYQAANVAAVEVSENTLDALARMVRELRPRAVHIAAGLVESGRRIGLNISGDTGMRKVAPRPLTAADLRSMFGEGNVTPLLILDPPAPPGLSERVRQLCLRNAFAAELANSGACAGILATGLGDANQQEQLVRSLVVSMAERWPLVDMVRKIWMLQRPTTALGDLLPFVGTALFAAGAELSA